jgi:uncharacterized protein (DUF934 family)
MNTMKLIAVSEHSTRANDPDLGFCQNVIELANDVDPRTLVLAGVDRVDLNFPKFTDGRAFSQAFLLRRRLGFQGEIRATGDVLIDQLVQMERTGFSTAVVREDQNLDFVQRQFDRYKAFYQGDVHTPQPQFARKAAA